MIARSTHAAQRNTTARSAVNFGRARRVVRNPLMSTVVNTRTTLVVMLAILGCTVAFVLAVVNGDFPVPLEQIPAILGGTEDGFASTVVLEWRLPRAVAALVFGAALAISGTLFQSVSRNPLGSPDVIGLGAGAFTGVLVAALWSAEQAVTVGFALAGGIATALVVYLFSYRRGLSGMRFIVVGIAVSSSLTAVNSILLLRMSTRQATLASVWGQGTLSDLRWTHVAPVGLCVLASTVVVLMLGPRLRQLELGDSTAHATGVRIEPTRVSLLAVGVVLIAIVTSVTGPIAFVALAAPQLARLLSGSAGTTIVGSAAVGALLLSGSDIIAAHLLPVSAPVGVVTVVIGGVYLLVLILREARRS